MRLNTLSNIRTLVKAEIGVSITVGTQKDGILNTLISDTQIWLSSEYDWPFLEDRWDDQVGAGSRYRSVPTTAAIAGANTPINFERPVRVDVKWASLWSPVEYGIENSEYNIFDSDVGNQSDPIQRWRMAGETAGGGLQYEIWPIPASQATVRFTGQRTLDALTADANKADLDDMLLVYWVAAAYKGSEALIAQAQNRLNRLRGVYPAREKSYIVGRSGGPDGNRVQPVPMKIVAVHG